MKRFLALMSLLLMVCLTASAIELKSNIQKTFQLNGSKTVDIENSFGTVTFESWPVQEAQIMVEIKVDAKTTDRAKAMLDIIEVSLQETDTKITGKTKIKNMNNRNSEKFSIDYTIRIPENTIIQSTNSFGDTYINLPIGPSTVNQSFGGVFVQNQTSHLDVGIQHGSGQFQNIEDMNLTAQFSEITAHEIDFIDLNISFSEFEAQKVNNLIIDVKHSEIDIEQVGRVNDKSQYSNINLGTIDRSYISKTMQFTDFKVKKPINESFDTIQINSKFGGIDFSVSKQSEYKFKLNSEFGDVKIMDDLSIIKRIKGDMGQTVEGYMNNQNATSIIDIESSFTNVKIK